jgi:hypothetical protein
MQSATRAPRPPGEPGLVLSVPFIIENRGARELLRGVRGMTPLAMLSNDSAEWMESRQHTPLLDRELGDTRLYRCYAFPGAAENLSTRAPAVSLPFKNPSLGSTSGYIHRIHDLQRKCRLNLRCALMLACVSGHECTVCSAFSGPRTCCTDGQSGPRHGLHGPSVEREEHTKNDVPFDVDLGARSIDTSILTECKRHICRSCEAPAAA